MRGYKMDKYQKILETYKKTVLNEDIEKSTHNIKKMLDEGMGAEAVLKNLRWEQIMYKFFDMYNMLKNSAKVPKAKKSQIAFMSAESMLKTLQEFIDYFPKLERLEKASTQEIAKLRNI
jgi:hypothetical protein